MIKKFLPLLLLLSLCLAAPVDAKKIVWVAESGRDDDADGRNDAQDWVDKLTEAGYEVDFRPGNWAALTATLVTELNAADLVVMSCTSQSGTYATDAAEIALWNSVTAPMMLTSPYIARSNRWQWINNGDGTLPNNNGDQGSPRLQAVATNHPIFYGVTLDGNNQLNVLDPALGSGHASFLATNNPGNGILIAKTVPSSLVQDWCWIVEWPKGTKFYEGSSYSATNLRMYVTGIGAHEVTSTYPMRGYNLTDDGWKLFSSIIKYMLGEPLLPPTMAGDPYPANGKTDVPVPIVATWKPGTTAQTHDVYFGTTFEAVDGASRTAPGTVLVSKGQTDATYNPAGIEFGATYYWRVDEVEASPSTTIHKGEVWSFTVEAASIAIADVNAEADSSFDTSSVASKTVDGSGLDTTTDTHGTTASDMWISGMTPLPHWIQFSFDKLYKLDQMAVWNSNQTMEGLFGLGAKNVLVQVSTDGTSWTDVGNFVFTKAPGNTTCAADTKVPLGGVAAKYVKLTISSNWGGLFTQASLSEVRFYAIPTVAREPSPATGTADLYPQVAMSWRAGRGSASHEVYVGSDANAVAASTTPTATVTAAKYDAALGLGQTYYWKVVEVNQAADPTSWASPVWSFSTATFITVDDFESYTNDSPRRVFQTWIDGSGFSPDDFFPNGNSGNGTGSLVGNDPTLGDIMEKTVIYGGNQSMPLFYDNSTGSKISEAIRTLDPAKDTTDWSKHGLTTLVLFFHGSADNGAAPVYVKINNTKKVYNNGAAATTTGFWRQWNIDLASIPAADLKAVKTITIGVGDGSAGGSGTILADEIRLYAAAPAIPVLTDPGTTGLVAYYAMNGDVLDGSGGGNSGTLVSEPGFVDGMAAFGKALALDGIDDCVDLGKKAAFNPTGSFSVSLWANITAWGTAWNHVMIGNRGESDLGWQIRRHLSTSLCFTTRGADQDDTPSAMVPPQNEWINIVCVYDDAASTKDIYVNGHQEAHVATTAGQHIAATTMNTYIGARDNGSGTPEAFFTGQLDEIRLFNRALTAGEAAYLAGDR